MHFLTVCPKYNSLRTKLLDKVEKSVTNSKFLSPTQKLIFMFISENLQVIQWLIG